MIWDIKCCRMIVLRIIFVWLWIEIMSLLHHASVHLRKELLRPKEAQDLKECWKLIMLKIIQRNKRTLKKVEKLQLTKI